MIIEIEAKMRVEDRAGLESMLRSLQAVRVGKVIQRNIYFDDVGAGLRGSDQGLRIRIERTEDGSQTEVTLTHKGPRAAGSIKVRQETELSVDDPERATQLLDALGYRSVLMFEKRRDRWRLDECHVEIDTLPHLGCFLEIEGPSKETILAVRQKLGMAESPLVTKSYASLMAAFLDEQGDARHEVVFADVTAE